MVRAFLFTSMLNFTGGTFYKFLYKFKKCFMNPTMCQSEGYPFFFIYKLCFVNKFLDEMNFWVKNSKFLICKCDKTLKRFFFLSWILNIQEIPNNKSLELAAITGQTIEKKCITQQPMMGLPLTPLRELFRLVTPCAMGLFIHKLSILHASVKIITSNHCL